MAILHPYEPVRPGEPVDVRAPSPIPPDPFVERQGREGLLLCISNRIETARRLREALTERGADFGLAVLRRLKPLPSSLADFLADAPRVVTLEEGMLVGGLGSAIAELICDAGLRTELLRSGVGDRFVEGGSKADLSRREGLDVRGILARMERRWPALLQPASSPAGSAGEATANDSSRRTISSGS